MSVRRFVTACAVVGFIIAVGASPASAAVSQPVKVGSVSTPDLSGRYWSGGAKV